MAWWKLLNLSVRNHLREKFMINKKKWSIPFCIIMGLFVVSCTSPTIRKHIEIRSPNQTHEFISPGIQNAQLLGGNGADWGQDIHCFRNDSCVVFGTTIKSFGESTDLVATKLSSKREILWSYIYGGRHKESLNDIIKSNDGGFVMLGGSQSLFKTPLPGHRDVPRPLIVKISKNGDIQWALTFEAPEVSLFNGIQTRDSGFLLVGYQRIRKNKNINRLNTAVIKITNNGNIDWVRRYDRGVDDVGRTVTLLPDNSIIIAGQTMTSAKKSELFATKISNTGDLFWSKSYTSKQNIQPGSSIKSSNDGAIISGTVFEGSTDQDMFAAHISPNGKVSWIKKYGSSTIDTSTGLIRTQSNGFLLIGRSGLVTKNQQNGAAIIIGRNGKMKSSTLLGGGLNDDLRGASILTDGNYYLSFTTMSFGAKNVDMLTAVWSPPENVKQNQFNFTENSIHISTIDVETKYYPIDYTKVDITKFNYLFQKSILPKSDSK